MSEINKNSLVNPLETQAVAPTEPVQSFLPLNMVLSKQEGEFFDSLTEQKQWLQQLPARISSEISEINKQLRQNGGGNQAKYLEVQKAYLNNCLKLVNQATNQKSNSETPAKDYSESTLAPDYLSLVLPKTPILEESLPGLVEIEGDRLNQLFSLHSREIAEKVKGPNWNLNLVFTKNEVTDQECEEVIKELEEFKQKNPNENYLVNIGVVNVTLAGSVRIQASTETLTGEVTSLHAEAQGKVLSLQGLTPGQVYDLMGECAAFRRIVNRLLRHMDSGDRALLATVDGLEQIGAYAINTQLGNLKDDVFFISGVRKEYASRQQLIASAINEVGENQAVAAFMKFAGMSRQEAVACMSIQPFQCITAAVSELVSQGVLNFDEFTDPNSSLEKRQEFANTINEIYRKYLPGYANNPKADSLTSSQLQVVNQYLKNMFAALHSSFILSGNPFRPFNVDVSNIQNPVSATNQSNNLVSSEIMPKVDTEFGINQSNNQGNLEITSGNSFIDHENPLLNEKDLVLAGVSSNNSDNSIF